MDLTIVDATGNKTEEVSVPDTVASGRIVGRLVQLLQLPAMGPDGQPLSYKFHHKQSGRQINDNETLGDAGVKENDVLRLVAEITAGAWGPRPVSPSSCAQCLRAPTVSASRSTPRTGATTARA